MVQILGGWGNARHMVRIKTRAREQGVYISKLPTGLCCFMRGCASHGAQSAVIRIYKSCGEEGGKTQSSRVFFHPAPKRDSITN